MGQPVGVWEKVCPYKPYPPRTTLSPPAPKPFLSPLTASGQACPAPPLMAAAVNSTTPRGAEQSNREVTTPEVGCRGKQEMASAPGEGGSSCLGRFLVTKRKSHLPRPRTHECRLSLCHWDLAQQECWI